MNVIISLILIVMPLFVGYKSFMYYKHNEEKYYILAGIFFLVLAFIVTVFIGALLQDYPVVFIVLSAVFFVLINKKLNKINPKEYKEKQGRKRKEAEKAKEDLKNLFGSDIDTSNIINVEMSLSRSSGDKDSFEGWFYDEVEEYIDFNKTFKIKYKDAAGKTSKRTIDVYRFGNASFGFFLLAHCKLRNANRTFRTDRILECIDMDTGEIISDVDKYFSDIYYNSEQYKEREAYKKRQEEKAIQNDYYESFIDKHKVLLKVLMYIVKCDGSFSQREKAIIKEILENIEDNNELLTDKVLEKIYKNTPLPTLQTFKINVGKLLADEKISIDLVEITKNIIATQKTVHQNEQEALEYIVKKTATV